MRSHMLMILLAGGIMAAPAEAATYLITYTGTVSGSSDAAGLFGPAGGTLDGAAFKAVYKLTDPTPGALYSDTGDSLTISGGSHQGIPSPMSAKLTINGVTKFLSGDYESRFFLYSSAGSDQVAHYVQEKNLDYIANYITGTPILNPPNLKTLFDYTVKASDRSSGDFILHDKTFDDSVSYGTLTPAAVDMSLASSAVPEPATWLMMIGGFGLTGLALRRRNASARLAVG